MQRVEPGGMAVQGIMVPDANGEGYEVLSDRLERMKSVVANLQCQVRQLTNRMGDFIEARPPERPPMIIRPISVVPRGIRAGIGQQRIMEGGGEGQEVGEEREEEEERSSGEEVRCDSPSVAVEVRCPSPEALSELEDPRLSPSPSPSPRPSGRLSPSLSPSPEPQLSRTCSSEWERKSFVGMGCDDSDDGDGEYSGGPCRPHTPSQSMFESPSCRSTPSSFDSPRVPSLYQPNDWDEESIASGSEDCEGGIPWRNAPQRMQEIVEVLKGGGLPEGTVLGFDDSPPNPEVPLPASCSPLLDRPWEGKVKLQLQASGILNGGNRASFSHDVSPFSVCDSAAPGYSGSHAGSVVFGSGSRAGSMASVEGREMSPCVQTKPFRVHSNRPSNGELFVFGKEAM